MVARTKYKFYFVCPLFGFSAGIIEKVVLQHRFGYDAPHGRNFRKSDVSEAQIEFQRPCRGLSPGKSFAPQGRGKIQREDFQVFLKTAAKKRNVCERQAGKSEKKEIVFHIGQENKIQREGVVDHSRADRICMSLLMINLS